MKERRLSLKLKEEGKVRKVFLFWSIILISLIGGTVLILHGKMLLEKETAQNERIKKEVALSKKGAGLAATEIGAPHSAQAYKMAEDVGLPRDTEVTEIEAGLTPPHTHGLPTMPRLTRPAE